MNDYKNRILSYTERFTEKYGYTPTTYQISNELYIPLDKVGAVMDALKAEGAIRITRPL